MFPSEFTLTLVLLNFCFILCILFVCTIVIFFRKSNFQFSNKCLFFDLFSHSRILFSFLKEMSHLLLLFTVEEEIYLALETCTVVNILFLDTYFLKNFILSINLYLEKLLPISVITRMELDLLAT